MKAITNLDSTLKIIGITLTTQVSIIKDIPFPVFTYECESWTIKKAEHQRTEVFKLWCEKTLESPLDSKEVTPVNLKEINLQFFGRTDDEAEAPILWQPDGGKYGRQMGKGVAEDEMVIQNCQFNGNEFEQTQGDSGGLRSLACCGLWDCKESDMTQQLNNKSHHLSHLYSKTAYSVSVLITLVFLSLTSPEPKV